MKYWYLFLICFIAFTGCSESYNMDIIEEQYSYINFPDDTDFNSLSYDDLKIVSKAISRLKIYEDNDGLLKSKVQSGAEINISENLFSFIISVIEKGNEEIISDAGLYRHGLISRSEWDNYFRRTDCFAWAIATATSYTYDYISTELYNKYGDQGVPMSAATSILTGYANTSVFSTTSLNYNLGPNYIVILRNSDGSYHAVTGVCLEGSTVWYKDYQASVEGNLDWSNRNNIERIYYVRDYNW